MESEYRRDTHHSYLVLYETEETEEESFQTRMFLENAVPGFLACRRYEIDCSGRFFYDISSRQSLVGILETGTADRRCLEVLITSILRALSGLQSFLLDEGGFCLKVEWIYTDPALSEFQFCYFPGGSFSWKEQLRQLAEYLLPRLEHKNRETVQLGYAFYQAVMDDRIASADLEELLLQDKEIQQERELKNTPSEAATMTAASGSSLSGRELPGSVPTSREDLLSAFFEEEDQDEEKRGKKIKLPERLKPAAAGRLSPIFLWAVPLGIGGIGTFLLWYLAYDLAAIGCVLAAIAVIAVLQLRSINEKKVQERDAAMEQYAMVQDWMEEEKEEERLLQQKEKEEHPTETSTYDEDATCLLTSESAYSRLAKGYLIPDSSDGGTAIAIDQEVTMIGKSSQMDVVLKGLGISRIHARILCRGDDCFLSDRNSRNGTKLNGILLKPEEEQPLSDGDRITFANTGFEWKCYRL
ncbi:MAG: DUF6382 domain-containing protein [Lachnospiraceae bacterium]|nr:DUF6382 domain-containing protein [Lachnospiraceae bacterium]